MNEPVGRQNVSDIWADVIILLFSSKFGKFVELKANLVVMNRCLVYILLLFSALCAAMPALAAETVPVQDERQADVLPTVEVTGMVLEFRTNGSEPVKFKIFSITGQLIKTIVVKSVPVKVELPKGFYIVKCDTWTKRVMLK